MESFLRNWMRWPSLEAFMSQPWAWPLAETLHFIGICLLVAIIGLFDLRMLGIWKDLPMAPLRRLLPWAVFGFTLCVMSGLGFVLGIGANLYGANAYDILITDPWLQLKLIFMGLAGINLLAFYLTGVSHTVDALGPGEDAPPLAKVIGMTSLVSWLLVVYFGRLIPWGL